MEILKTAIEWAKDEIFSSILFILFGTIFIAAAIGFWQLGKTEVAKAFIYPPLVAGILLLIAGIGMVYSNKSRISTFKDEYKTDSVVFIKSEIARTENTMDEYKKIALKVFPIVIVVAALLIIFVDKPIWRAISITTIAMMIVLIWVDSNANARIKSYHRQLISAEK